MKRAQLLKSATIEAVQDCMDVELLDFVYKLLIDAQGEDGGPVPAVCQVLQFPAVEVAA